MKLIEMTNKEQLRKELVSAAKAWLSSKPKNATHPTAPPIRSMEPTGPDLGTPEVKALGKAVKAYSTYKLLDLSVNPEDTKLVGIWLDDRNHTILQVDTVNGTATEY